MYDVTLCRGPEPPAAHLQPSGRLVGSVPRLVPLSSPGKNEQTDPPFNPSSIPTLPPPFGKAFPSGASFPWLPLPVLPSQRSDDFFLWPGAPGDQGRPPLPRLPPPRSWLINRGTGQRRESRRSAAGPGCAPRSPLLGSAWEGEGARVGPAPRRGPRSPAFAPSLQRVCAPSRPVPRTCVAMRGVGGGRGWAARRSRVGAAGLPRQRASEGPALSCLLAAFLSFLIRSLPLIRPRRLCCLRSPRSAAPSGSALKLASAAAGSGPGPGALRRTVPQGIQTSCAATEGRGSAILLFP